MGEARRRGSGRSAFLAVGVTCLVALSAMMRLVGKPPEILDVTESAAPSEAAGERSSP